MQYASPKSVWNIFFGVTQPSLKQTEGNDMHEINFYAVVDLHHFIYFPISLAIDGATYSYKS